MNRLIAIFVGLVGLGLVGFLLLRANTPESSLNDRVISVSDGAIVLGGELLDAPEAKERYKIGVLFPFLAAPFWVNEAYGVIDQASKVGVDVIWLSADGYDNIERQNNQIQDLIARDVDAILLAATSYAGTAPAVDQAAKAGIPVFAHVTSSDSEGILISVVNDDAEIGRTQARYMAEALGGQGTVAMLNGPAAADWASQRVAGFKEVIKQDFPEIQIVAERFGVPDRVDAQQQTEDLLVAFPDLGGIFTVADGMALGAADAVSNASKTGQVKITTASFSRETVPYIRDGRIYVNVDENPVLMGRSVLNIAVRALNGQELPRTIIVPSPAISADNVDSVEASVQWAPEAWALK